MNTNPKNSTSDADVTLELTTTRMAALIQPDPVIKTEELTANDILEVHNAVRAMQAAEVAGASPDKTSEVDALDILEAESIAIEAPRVVLPRALPPPHRNEPTRIIHRDLILRVRRVLTQKRARSVLILAAAFGTWAFFASFAIVGVYGAGRLVSHFSSHATSNDVARVSTPPALAADEASLGEKSDDLAPLLEIEANQLARVSSSNENASTDLTPRASGVSPNNTASHDDIFRRPSKTQVGVLRVSSSVHGLLVDGTPERVTGGSLILACGDHRIRPPHASARVVRVPCGKTVVL
ncbi:MAG: hypothetical protein ABI183_03025 [Polyangiaceae bacterium]